jgi:signal transduction histidine kinase
MAKSKILFLDDERNVLEGLKRMLRDHMDTWDMTFLNDPQAAVPLLKSAAHQVAVLDVMMPNANGLDLLAQIKADADICDAEVIILTGLRDRDLKSRALELGAADLLNKPVLREDLLARVNSALRMKSYHEELKAQNARLEEQLIQSQKMEVVGTLAAGLAHDLRNIVGAILGHSELTERIAAHDEKLRTSIGRVRSAGLRAKHLVEQIMTLSRRTESKYEPCNLGAIIEECLELLRPTLASSTDVVWEGSKTNYLVEADPTQMYQVVMNLCLNASQAMKQGGTLTVSLTDGGPDEAAAAPNAGPRGGPCVKLEVADTGVGMDEATRARIFEPLFSTKAAQGGTGLGLSVVHRIVQNHGGVIAVESSPGQGTRVSLYLSAGGRGPEMAPHPMETSDVS